MKTEGNPAPTFLRLFWKNPLRFLGRVFEKMFVGPFRYGRGDAYDSRRFWRDRYSKYGLSLQGSGDEGFNEDENLIMYEDAAKALLELARLDGISFSGRKVLDIGCGPGYYSALMQQQGVASYTGVDITDVLFPDLRAKFPDFRFTVADATNDSFPLLLNDTYDIILLIDVIQNIVTESKFSALMQNVKNQLHSDGVFVIAPIMPKNKKHLYYMHFWSMEDLQKHFSTYRFGSFIPFRHDRITSIRRQHL